jgi:hypothetical protein
MSSSLKVVCFSITQLDSLHDNNPKLYWNLINDLRQQTEKDQRGSVVDPPSWVSHFEKLNQVKDEFKERVEMLSSPGDFPHLNLEMAFEISALLMCMSSSLKVVCFSNKSSWISRFFNRSLNSSFTDNISTNMLKCAQNELLPSIEKLFNSCLFSGNYPKNWAVGYILIPV